MTLGSLYQTRKEHDPIPSLGEREITLWNGLPIFNIHPYKTSFV